MVKLSAPTIKVSSPTIQDNFNKSVLQNPISNEPPERQAEVVLSRVRLGLLQGFPVSSVADENGAIAFELAKGHLNNSYLTKLPLPLIKSAFAVIAQQAGITDGAAQAVMIVKKPGFFRDKVVAYLPNEEFMQKLTSQRNAETSPPHGFSPRMN